ncbi:MAG: YaiI/YqxD family protein, partial [Myxococcota bacterium]
MMDKSGAEKKRPTIWVDGDAAPKACKEVVFKAGGRVGIQVVLVANHFQMLPRLPQLRFVQVGGGMDV